MNESPARLRIGRDLLPLAGLVPAALLPPLPSLIALLGLTALWLSGRPPRRESIAVAALVAIAAGALAADVIGETGRADSIERRHRAVAFEYGEFWQRLREIAADTATGLEGVELGGPEREELFGRLTAAVDRTEGAEASALTAMIVDPDGQAIAWAGEGFLNEPEPAAIPASGATHWTSFGSTTLGVVQPLSGERRPWRLVVGRSFLTDELPASFDGGGVGGARWTIVDEPGLAASGVRTLRAPDAPSLVVPDASLASGRDRWPGRRVALGAVAIALVAVAGIRAFAVALQRTDPAPTAGRYLSLAALSVAGLVTGGLAVDVPFPPLATLLSAAVVAVAATAAGGGWRRPWGPVTLGVVAFAFPLAAAYALHRWWRLVDLGGVVIGDATTTVLHLAAISATGATLVAARGDGGEHEGRRRAAVVSLVSLLVAAAFHDLWRVAVPTLTVSGAAAGLWFWRADTRLRAGSLAVATLVAALAAAVGWEIGYRAAFRWRIGERLLPAMAPPLEEELEAVWEETDRYFQDFDLLDLTPRDPTDLNWGDLAYAIWRRSPLVRKDALSAVAVVPLAGEPIRFSFGLPLTEDATLDREPVRWQRLELPYWRQSLIQGDTDLRGGGRMLGRIRYWLLPTPGFRLGEVERGELAADLLRGGPSAAGPVQGLPPTLEYALYRPDGAPLHTPWRESSRLQPEIEIGEPAIVEIPPGRAWAFTRSGPDGIEVLYLPFLSVGEALERIGTHALASVLVGLAVAAVLVLFALPRAPFRRAVRRSFRSYSKRLLAIYGALILVPLLLLTAVLFQVMEERLRRDQLQAGEVALDSAQHVLGEFMLTLEPGISLDTELDDSLLVWLSRVVQHEINLYWESTINASSKRELFSAGLLPQRIPGEIYARLALDGQQLANRVARAGDRSYLELYAPLSIPGVEPAAHRLFLSMPLLAQQEEAAAELQELRRQAVLVTAVLFLVAVAVGNRLARGFTRPIDELVAGTERIAAGASSLDMEPTESELEKVVDAVDDMARRIAEGRRRLVREKQVVERIVDTITSGVVSIDDDGRVLLCNRVAAELLPVEPGSRLVERLRGHGELAPVAEFVQRAGAVVRETTVRLHDAEEERQYRLVWVPVPGDGVPSALLVVEDATEVLRAERLQAWAEMARIIAHEVKNPLTPIRLSTEHMREVHRGDGDDFDEVFERCSTNILRQVDELRRIAEEFSTYSRIPRLELEQGDLRRALSDLVEAYRTAPPPGVEIRYHDPGSAVDMRFDERLLTRAVRNLIENAIRAVDDGGFVDVRLDPGPEEVRIVVADSGGGVPTEMLGRIFEPYFSTHDTGTGLGLPIARRITEEHGGSVEADNRPGGDGLRVTMRIPR